MDKEIDGIIGVKFTNKYSGFFLMIFSCYLSPENSPWGRNDTQFYSHLISQLYIYSDVDAIFICGDLNSRIGKENDVICELDGVKDRQPLVL